MLNLLQRLHPMPGGWQEGKWGKWVLRKSQAVWPHWPLLGHPQGQHQECNGQTCSYRPWGLGLQPQLGPAAKHGNGEPKSKGNCAYILPEKEKYLLKSHPSREMQEQFAE